MKGLLGIKLGMTQLFDEAGEVVPVTIIEAGPCFVTQVKTTESDGYNAVQVGFGETKQNRLTGGQKGHLGLLKSNKKTQRKKTSISRPFAFCVNFARKKQTAMKLGRGLPLSSLKQAIALISSARRKDVVLPAL